MIIRDLQTLDDLAKVEAVEREVWGLSDIDVLPLTAIIASHAAGHMWIGAFEGNVLAGFAYAFPSVEQGVLKMHSHMMGVREQYRDQDLGYKLKLAQRDRGLAAAISGCQVREITWTFDPLQSRNAHLNFGKLGVVSDDYRTDFYGPETSSVLHRNGTDRLWVRWPISGKRVAERVQPATVHDQAQRLSAGVAPLISVAKDGTARRGDLASAVSRQQVTIQIPGNASSAELANSSVANDWRQATRWAFSESLAAGFVVAEFLRKTPTSHTGTYLLSKGSVDDYLD